MKQITEDYVTFEIATLLKEKGFDIPCRSYYNNNNYLSFEHPKGFVLVDSVYLLRPTHQMALKWLKKIHGIYITSEPDINDKHCFYPAIYAMKEESWDVLYIEELEHLRFDEPEQAIEASLKYTLKNLI